MSQWGGGLLLWEGGTQKAHTAQEGLVTATGGMAEEEGEDAKGSVKAKHQGAQEKQRTKNKKRATTTR